MQQHTCRLPSLAGWLGIPSTRSRRSSHILSASHRTHTQSRVVPCACFGASAAFVALPVEERLTPHRMRTSIHGALSMLSLCHILVPCHLASSWFSCHHRPASSSPPGVGDSPSVRLALSPRMTMIVSVPSVVFGVPWRVDPVPLRGDVESQPEHGCRARVGANGQST
jgi:hypothetical protein